MLIVAIVKEYRKRRRLKVLDFPSARSEGLLDYMVFLRALSTGCSQFIRLAIYLYCLPPIAAAPTKDASKSAQCMNLQPFSSTSAPKLDTLCWDRHIC
jgi:hypothetical protein